MRAAKTTQEIQDEELDRLKRPEARETTALDAAELRGLVEQSIADEDDLALPIEAAPAASNVSAPASNEFDEPGYVDVSRINPVHYTPDGLVPATSMPARPRGAIGSAGQAQLARPPASLLPWIIGLLIASVGIAIAMWMI